MPAETSRILPYLSIYMETSPEKTASPLYPSLHNIRLEPAGILKKSRLAKKQLDNVALSVILVRFY